MSEQSDELDEDETMFEQQERHDDSDDDDLIRDLLIVQSFEFDLKASVVAVVVAAVASV